MFKARVQSKFRRTDHLQTTSTVLIRSGRKTIVISLTRRSKKRPKLDLQRIRLFLILGLTALILRPCVNLGRLQSSKKQNLSIKLDGMNVITRIPKPLINLMVSTKFPLDHTGSVTNGRDGSKESHDGCFVGDGFG